MAKVLVVDDDPDVVETVSLVLRREGYEVAAAHTRLDGLAQVASFQPNLIMLDVMMEQQDDGIALAQQLRREGCKTPILMLTNVSKVTGFKFQKDGDVVPVDDFQEKPIEPAVLVRKVRALLDAAEAQS